MRLPQASTCLFALASAALLWHGWRPALPSAAFVVSPGPLPCLASAVYQSCTLPLPAGAPMLHSPTLAALGNGDLLAVWFAGRVEGSTDVALYQALCRQGVWSEPRAILSPRAVGEAEHRWTARLGNPTLYRDPRGRLFLFFVSAQFGWSTSSLNLTTSDDDGGTWTPPRRLITSPFCNLSTLARNPAVPLADGGFYLPAYHECVGKFPELLRFDADARLLGRVRMDKVRGSLQPALVPLDEQHAVSFQRNYARGGQRVLCQRTANAGQHWSPPEFLELYNFDTAVAGGRLADGTLLLAHNPGNAIHLTASVDGIHWDTVADLENASAHGFSIYPTMVVNGDAVDLVYSWQRRLIKHVRFNAAWIKERLSHARH